jgi:predicted HAD superfamily Cof-like phosphohydrolase
MSSNIFEDMREMHIKYQVDKWTAKASKEQLKEFLRFRINFLVEELTETQKAFDEQDAEEIVDGLIDLIVVAAGTLDAFDVNGEKAWNEVLKANMAKEVGVKASRPNPLGLPDLIKPEGWTAPSHKNNHGMLHEAFDN